MQSKRAALSLVGLMTWCVVLAPKAARSQTPNPPRLLITPTPAATPPDWMTPACVEWWDMYSRHNVGATVEDARRGRACTWQTSGCAEWWPKWHKREVPDTPENEQRGQACIHISPWESFGCPEVTKKATEESNAGLPYSGPVLEGLRSCIHLGGNPARENQPAPQPPSRWAHGPAYVTVMPPPPSPSTPMAPPPP